MVPSEGVRLSELLDLGSEDESFRRRLAEAEEGIYGDRDNPLVNWTADDFCGMLETAGFRVLNRETRGFSDLRTIRSQDVGRWFAPGGGSYAARAGAVLSSAELDRLREICSDQLTGRELDWRSTVLFVRAENIED